MSTIDSRVVEMKFDNALFERRVTETIKSLETLNTKLDLSNNSRGFDGITDAAGRVNLGGISEGIEGVSKKFLALSTIAITTLATITTKALQTGAQLLKSFSLDPVMAGFSEYETNMNSIQTILANTDSKGTTLEQVNKALDQLNQYSDQTIYNFGEMAKNIGTFTAAGVGLDTSVNSIKGIANLAAISGSNSQQASTAMYQLSQAIASGSVKLMDWNSIVNAGMGGEVFQKALFETGKSLGTIKDVPIDQTFEQWTKAGNTFRGSLEEGWLTSQVLTNTLQGFTGDLDQAQLQALGYTEAQAVEMMRLGKLGKSAATEVKTLTQLLSTVKESVGSGWSASFRLIFGDFNQAKELFTGLNNAIGGFVGRSADARNALLQGWSDMGGRTLLITALKNAFYGLSKILKPIQEAFRSVFPKTTSEELFKLTQGIAVFAQRLIPSQKTIENLRSAFQGFFYAIKIGAQILKGVFGVFVDLFDALVPKGAGGGVLGFFANLGDSITRLYGTLLATQAIPEFFEKVSASLRNIIQFGKDAFNAIKEFISALNIGEITGIGDAVDSIGGAFDRVKDRYSGFADIFKTDIDLTKFLGPFEKFLEPIKTVFQEIEDYVKTWFTDLGDKMGAAAEEGDYSKVMDALNVGLLAGIAGILAKFLKDGIGVNFGDGLFGKGGIFGDGVVNKINDTFGALTGTLKAMQTDIKANALLKIAGAIGILTASVLVLSLIDSGDLTKALTAMAVGFSQLLAVFVVVSKFASGPSGSLQFAAIAGGMILLSTAVLILSGALLILGTMSWEEIGRGLAALGGLLLGLAIATKLLSGPGVIAAGLAMVPLAIGINLLAVAMKVFATMSWEDIAKGMVGVVGGLLGIALAMNLMPVTMPLIAAGLVLVGVALNLIAASMLIFATMSWEEIGKGIVGVAGGLVAIALAMQLMPITLPITAAGLVLVGVALGLIAAAMLLIANMSWEEIGRGLAGMAGALIILALATAAMTGSLAGAAALGIVTLALGGLVRIIKEFAKLSIAEIATGLGAIAAVILVLAGTAALVSGAIPALLGLGVALILVGAGFALFGFGVSLVAKGFQILAKAGTEGAKAFVAALDIMLTHLPKVAVALANAVIDFIMVFVEAAPIIIEQLGIIVGHLLETLAKLIPQGVKLMGEFITAMLDYLITLIPKVVEVGYAFIKGYLNGIRNNIGEIVTIVAQIITEFLNALADNLGSIIEAGKNLIVAWIEGIVGAYGDIITAGVDAVIAFLQGIADNIVKIVDAGFDIVINLINGIADSIRENRKRLSDAGVNLLDAMFGGIISKAVSVFAWFTALPAAVVTAIGSVFSTLVEKGASFLSGLLSGAVRGFGEVGSWLGGLGRRVLDSIPNPFNMLLQAGKDIMSGLWDGMKNGWDKVTGWLGKLNPAKWKGPEARDKKMLVDPGLWIMEGLQTGLSAGWDDVTTWLKTIDPAESLGASMSKIPDILGDLDAIDPTITPVLDLTQVESEARKIGDLMRSNPLTADLSLSQARDISNRTSLVSPTGVDQQTTGGSSLVYEQNIYAPTELSAATIYRQSRNQLAVIRDTLEA